MASTLLERCYILIIAVFYGLLDEAIVELYPDDMGLK